MSVKIHCLLTGALESSYATSVYGAPERHPLVKKADLLPHGHKERVYAPDGSFQPGLMVPVPVWLIEGDDQTILIDTGLGDCAEIMEMQNRYGIDYIATKSREEEIETALARKGLKPDDIVKRLLTKKIIASTSPYAVSYARLAPSLVNTPQEVERAAREVLALAH